MLEAEIAATEQAMKADLDKIRARFTQSGDKGMSAEETVRSFLREYLPRRFEIGAGEVVDTHENRSRQMDVVIATEDHPYTFRPDSPGLFFVEAVAAAGEVKSVLTSGELARSLESARAFKQLRPKIPTGGGVLFTKQENVPERKLDEPPPWFLFAFESQLTLERTRETIVGFQAKEQLDDDAMPDAFFVLSRGWIINFRPGQGRGLKYGFQGQPPVEGWVAEDSPTVLFVMLAWLSSVTPRTLPLGPSLIVQYLVPDAPS